MRFHGLLHPSIHRLPALLLLVFAVLTASCSALRIPFSADSLEEDISLRVRSHGQTLEIRLPGNPAIESSDILRISMSQPPDSLRITATGSSSDGSGDMEWSHVLRPAQGLEPGLTVLNYSFAFDPEGASPGILDRLFISYDGLPDSQGASQGTSSGDGGATSPAAESMISLSLQTEPGPLSISDAQLTIPWNMDYRQEVRIPQGVPEGGEYDRIVLFQEVDFGSLLDGFDFLNHVPVLELAYEYRRPEEGMPTGVHDDDPEVEARSFAEPAPPEASLEILGESLVPLDSHVLRLRPGARKVYLYPEMFSSPGKTLRFTHDSVYGRLTGLSLLAIPREGAARSPEGDFQGPIPEPLPIDLGSLMEYSPALWRNQGFELFSWNLFPQVLIFDFADYALQARFLRRLAFFVEKYGYRGQLLSNQELASLHGWNAHNYHPRDLSRFYNQAEQESFQLNPEELFLRDILLERGILIETANGYAEGRGQMISVTSHPLQTRASRELFLNHEALHGLFYNFPPLPQLSTSLWNSLDPQLREYMELYFSYVGYDPEDSYLMINEFQAYMLQQDIVNLRWMVQTRMAERMARRFPGRAGFVYEHNVDAGWAMLEAGETLQTLIYQEVGLIAGDLFCLVPSESP